MTLCQVCGLPITETSTGIVVGEEHYHQKCISTLKCDSCGTVMGYLAKGGLEGSFRRTYCSNCSKKF